jgi:hypothetical protein
MSAAPDQQRAAGLTDRVEARLAGLDDQDVAAHPGAYEAMDAEVRSALGALEQL